MRLLANIVDCSISCRTANSKGISTSNIYPDWEYVLISADFSIGVLGFRGPGRNMAGLRFFVSLRIIVLSFATEKVLRHHQFFTN